MNLTNIFSKQKTQTDFSVSLGFGFDFKGNVKFAEVFTFEIFRKILTDCFDHAADFPKDKISALWDSVVSTEAREGLISLLANAMTKQLKIYVVFDHGYVRKATESERQVIDQDPSGKNGVCLDFGNFHRAKIVLMLAGLVEVLLISANTSLNVSKSVLLKISALRENVANANADEVIAQAKAISEGLKSGKGAILDGADMVEMPQYDTAPMEAALDVLYGLMSFITGMPRAYISGELTGGLNNSGEADETAIENGLAFYFHSIFNPVCKALLGCKDLVFKTSDWRKLAQVANLLPVVETSDAIGQETKERLYKELFG